MSSFRLTHHVGKREGRSSHTSTSNPFVVVVFCGSSGPYLKWSDRKWVQRGVPSTGSATDPMKSNLISAHKKSQILWS